MTQKRIKSKSANPFIENADHMGEMTVRQLVEIVITPEFLKCIDITIRIGDVEGNNGVNGDVCVCAHKPGDVVLSIDPHAGDKSYDPEG